MNTEQVTVRIAVLLEYDGTEFVGWQSQPNGRTVQDSLSHALFQLFHERVVVHGAGRTDAGVHARGMVAHIDLPEACLMPIRKLAMALNATTPSDIAIRDVRTVPNDFHARFSAVSRQYRYTIREERTALDRERAWSIIRPVEPGLLIEAAAILTGEHDFTSFSKRTNDVNNYRCSVEFAGWAFGAETGMSELDSTLSFTIRANRFVRGMVRALVGALVQVGQGDLALLEFKDLLQNPRSEARAKYLAPAHGLILEGVEYSPSFRLWAIGEAVKRAMAVPMVQGDH